ncbi:hypothetical protein COHA_002983 [Chlorella ohadii]|uniref:Uncharacterized protein n=1 Tax=Chlorella ohadii TaxID=2649997 RepID=A0AAD5DSW5_9CHLO|nr:hypothetical protein COHA_002983 [Chlorella ohadii]
MFKAIVWRVETPRLREELDRVQAAFDQLPDYAKRLPSYHVFYDEFLTWVYWESEDAFDLEAVLHNGASVVILDDAGRGWRLEVHAGTDPYAWRSAERKAGPVIYSDVYLSMEDLMAPDADRPYLTRLEHAEGNIYRAHFTDKRF